MPFRLRPVLLLAINLALLFAMAGIGLQQLRSAHEGTIESIHRLYGDTAILVDVEAARGHFEAQLREWKDILLFGSDLNVFEKHRARFDAEERTVQTLLKQARAQMAAVGTDVVDLDRLISDHAALGAQYRIALIGFDPRADDRARRVELRLRGVDHATSAAMARVSSQLETAAKRRAASETAEAVSRLAGVQRTLLLALAAAVLLTTAFTIALGRRSGGGARSQGEHPTPAGATPTA